MCRTCSPWLFVISAFQSYCAERKPKCSRHGINVLEVTVFFFSPHDSSASVCQGSFCASGSHLLLFFTAALRHRQVVLWCWWRARPLFSEEVCEVWCCGNVTHMVSFLNIFVRTKSELGLETCLTWKSGDWNLKSGFLLEKWNLWTSVLLNLYFILHIVQPTVSFRFKILFATEY